MDQKQSILIISAPIGSGHVKAARALGASIEQQDPEIEVRYANIFDFFNPMIGRLILRSYLKILQLYPAAYGAAYGWGNNSRFALMGRQLISRFLANRMSSYIKSVNPAAIVCTHATPAGLVAYLKQQDRLPMPAMAVVTDYVVHRLWVYPELDRYFVANDELADYLKNYGIGANKIAVTGIPIGSSFSIPVNKKDIYVSLGLANDCKTVLIMGGGAGVLPMEEIISACESIGKPLQLVAVCGNNEKLREKLAGKARTLRNCVLKSLGFVENVHELMTIADILVSKPGGVTSAEALAKGLPFLIYRPIPGQEEANTCYLKAQSVARQVNTPAELQTTLESLLFSDEAGLADMRSRGVLLGKPEAAEVAADGILEIIRQNLLD